MTKADREFIKKIAKQITVLTTRFDNLVKTMPVGENGRVVPFRVMPSPIGNNKVTVPGTIDNDRPKPIFAIVTKFTLQGVDTMPEQVKIQEELRTYLTDFCRMAGLDELQIHFKETQQ